MQQGAVSSAPAPVDGGRDEEIQSLQQQLARLQDQLRRAQAVGGGGANLMPTTTTNSSAPFSELTSFASPSPVSQAWTGPSSSAASNSALYTGHLVDNPASFLDPSANPTWPPSSSTAQPPISPENDSFDVGKQFVNMKMLESSLASTNFPLAPLREESLDTFNLAPSSASWTTPFDFPHPTIPMPPLPQALPKLVIATTAFVAQADGQLSFGRGDLLEILGIALDPNFYVGKIQMSFGLVPKAFVEAIQGVTVSEESAVPPPIFETDPSSTEAIYNNVKDFNRLRNSPPQARSESSFVESESNNSFYSSWSFDKDGDQEMPDSSTSVLDNGMSLFNFNDISSSSQPQASTSSSFSIPSPFKVRAIHSYTAEEDGELSFDWGDTVLVTNSAVGGDPNWYVGEIGGVSGKCRAIFFRPMTKDEEAVAPVEEPPPIPPIPIRQQTMSIQAGTSKLSSQQQLYPPGFIPQPYSSPPSTLPTPFPSQTPPSPSPAPSASPLPKKSRPTKPRNKNKAKENAEKRQALHPDKVLSPNWTITDNFMYNNGSGRWECFHPTCLSKNSAPDRERPYGSYKSSKSSIGGILTRARQHAANHVGSERIAEGKSPNWVGEAGEGGGWMRRSGSQSSLGSFESSASDNSGFGQEEVSEEEEGQWPSSASGYGGVMKSEREGDIHVGGDISATYMNFSPASAYSESGFLNPTGSTTAMNVARSHAPSLGARGAHDRLSSLRNTGVMRRDSVNSGHSSASGSTVKGGLSIAQPLQGPAMIDPRLYEISLRYAHESGRNDRRREEE